MTWLLIGVLIWIAVAIPLALVMGRSIRLAEARRKQESQARLEANFVASEAPPATAADATDASETVPPADAPAPAAGEEQPWTGPSTVPFAPSRLPWGGERPSGRRAAPPPLRAHAPQIEPTTRSSQTTPD